MNIKNRNIVIIATTIGISVVAIIAFIIYPHSHNYRHELTEIDSLCETNPEEAIKYIKKLKAQVSSWTEEDAWYYRLLNIKANDKAFIQHKSDKEILQIVSHYENSTNKQFLPIAYYYAGSTYRDIGDAQKSLDYFHKTIDLNNGKTNKALLSNAYTQCGFIFVNQGLYNDALKMFQKSEYIDKETNDTIKYIYTQKNIANIYSLKGETNKAIKYMRIAYNKSLETGNKTLIDDLNSQLASCYIENNNFKEADSLINSRIKGINSLYKNTYYTLASKIYFKENKFDYAKELCEKVLLTGDIYEKRTTSEILAKLYDIQGNYKKSVYNWKHYAIYNDSIDKLTITENIARMNNLYNQRKYENDILTNKVKITHRNFIICIMVALAIVFTIIFLWYIITTKKEHEIQIDRFKRVDTIQKQIIFTSKETIKNNKAEISRLTGLIKKLSSNNNILKNNNEKIIEQNNNLLVKYKSEREKLIFLTEKTERENLYKKNAMNLIYESSIYKKILSYIKSKKNLNNNDMCDLTNTFDELYPSFSKNIFSIYRMNKYEYVICILIKLSVSNNEISTLLSKTPGAITHTRKRLYQKMFKEHGTPNDFNNFIINL